MSLQGATVNVSLADLDNLRERLRTAEARVAEVERQAREGRTSMASPEAAAMLAAFRHALRIVQFAVANLHPATIRSWPHEGLRAVADVLEALGEGDDLQLAADFRSFAKLAAGFEAYRAEHTPPVVPASAEDWGPQTPEAKAVWEAYHSAQARATDHED